MPGINPLSALLQSTLDLGVAAELLQAKISVGDVLAALVLAPRDGQDALEILGQRVVAQLPPGVHPGETLLLEVNEFSGNRILVRNLGLDDPRNPVPTVSADLRAPLRAPQPAAAQASTPAPVPVREAVTQKAIVQETDVQTPSEMPVETPAAQSPKAAPPQTLAREVFVAASVRPAPHLQARIASARAAVQNAVQSAGTAAQRAVRTAADLLKAARMPDTPFTRTVAAIAPQAPARLPAVLARLDAALPRATEDTRIPTLRTLIAFTARLNPANEETLPAQISAYVSHVVEGAEPKLQQLLQAHSETAAQPSPPPARDAADRQVPARSRAIAQAHVAERAAASAHDLKSLVLSLLRDPPAGKSPTLAAALNETLITLTGTQLNTIASNAQDPGAIAFALPLYFHEGGKPAYLRIARDEQRSGGKIDADNFHVAFVLDTANLGTVAIDLQSTGRSVKVDVKTEKEAAASRFADTLGSLRSRLEHLRYRVAAVTANALHQRPVAPKKREPAGGLDLRA